jgi:four helix bundle protein
MSHRYQDLKVWTKAMELVRDAYRLTESFPAAERYGLTSQIRRAAVSIPSNIAEGQGRLTKGEFRQFLGQARGSLYEVETQLQLAGALGFMPKDAVAAFLVRSGEVNAMLVSLLSSMRERRGLET